MGVRIKRYTRDADIIKNPVYGDSSIDQRETIVDGYKFHWSVNETRNFLDEGIGRAHAAYAPGENVILDIIPFGTATS